MKTILEIICALLVVLFVYTGVSKFIDYQGFLNDLTNQPFPNWLASYLGAFLPTFEIAIAAGLIYSRTRKIALVASLVLMSLFTVYTAMVLFQVFERIPCSCGGVIKHLTWGQHLVFNLFFVAISIMGIALQKRQKDDTNLQQSVSKVTGTLIR